jgi:hypothetical protein
MVVGIILRKVGEGLSRAGCNEQKRCEEGATAGWFVRNGLLLHTVRLGYTDGDRQSITTSALQTVFVALLALSTIRQGHVPTNCFPAERTHRPQGQGC